MNHFLLALFVVHYALVAAGTVLHDPTLLIMNGIGAAGSFGLLYGRAPR